MCMGAGRRAVEGMVRGRAQRVGQFGGLAARRDDREGAPGEADDIGVRRVEAFGRPRAGRDRLAELRTGLGAADPAAARPMRAAAFDADAVHHAGAPEPVVARWIGGVKIGRALWWK